MKVLHYGMSNNKGGIEVVTMNVYRNIVKENVEFDFLVCGEKIAFEEEIKELGGKVFKITRRRENPIKHYLGYIRFFKDARGKYDAIHCSYCTLYSITPIIFAKLFGIPKIILHSRSSNFNTNRWRFKFAHRKNLLIADKIATDFLACSHLAAKFMFTPNRYNLSAYKIFRNPVILDNFIFNERCRNRIRDNLSISNSFLLGHVGAFLPVKNHSFIIAVFKELSNMGLDCKLILIGDGTKNFKHSIIKQAVTLGIHDKIIFTGVINNVNEYMQAMDALIFPSLYEGFGNVLIEAQAAGLKCFVSDCITTETDIVPGLIERISLDNSAFTWAEKIYKYALNPISKDERQIDKTILSDFSHEKCISKYKELYHCEDDSGRANGKEFIQGHYLNEEE